MKPLHIAASLRVLAKHLHVSKPSIDQARSAIERATTGRRSTEQQLMVDELERVTGVPIAELAKLTEKWLPK